MLSNRTAERGALFLLHRVALIGSDAELTHALASDVDTEQTICQELGGLPLALGQAGASLKERPGRLAHSLAHNWQLSAQGNQADKDMVYVVLALESYDCLMQSRSRRSKPARY